MKYRRISLLYILVFLGLITAGIYLQDGWAAIFIDYRAPALVLLAFILLLLLFGGVETVAQAYYDAATRDVVDHRLERYVRGLKLIKKAGGQLFLWGSLGAILGYLILINNLDEVLQIGSAVYFMDSCLWIMLVIRALLVHPALAALEYKIAKIRNGNAIFSRAGSSRVGPWPYMLVLFLLPAVSVGLFIALGADVLITIIPGAACFVPFAAFFPCAAGVGFGGIKAAFSTALKKKDVTKGDAEGAISVFKRLGYLAIELGAAGFMAKLIIMLTILEEPDAILGQVALALVPVFYGLYIAAAVYFPLAGRLQLMYHDKTE